MTSSVRSYHTAPSAFAWFLEAYWHQHADEMYGNLSDGLVDFRKTEGERPFKQLCSEISTLRQQGRFPKMSDIESAYTDSFWAPYFRIVTAEEWLPCEELLATSKCAE